MAGLTSFLIMLSVSAGLAADDDVVAPFTGNVVAVVDGDTISVTRGDVAELVYLYGIDCPELAQPFGPEARAYLDELALKKTVSVEPMELSVEPEPGMDRLPGFPEEKLFAKVILPDDTVLNHALVAEGLAWWYQDMCPENGLLKKLNAEAMTQQKGLWSDPAPLAPWDFRERQAKKAEKHEQKQEEQAVSVAFDGPGGEEGVFITKTGGQYHRHGCKYLDKTQRVISRAEAEQRGYNPCPECFPDALPKHGGHELAYEDVEDTMPAPRISREARRMPQPAEPRRPTLPVRPRPKMPQLGGPQAMELMAEHRPRLARGPNGKVLGITADNISRIPYANVIGIRDGDIIQSVNGVAIDSLSKPFELVNRFKNRKQFNIRILRNGQPRTLDITLP